MLVVDTPHPGESLQVITLRIYVCISVVVLPKLGHMLGVLIIWGNNCEVLLNFNNSPQYSKYNDYYYYIHHF